MAGAYKWKKLSEIDISFSFFDSLKNDYPEFEEWYCKKSAAGKSAFTYFDENEIGAFVMLKERECEEILLQNGTKLPAINRMKISTLKLSEQVEGNRLGEGAIGIALWKWMESSDEEVYVTVFPKHAKLIEMLHKFGFMDIGLNERSEMVLSRSKVSVDFSTPYSSFPFVNKQCEEIYLLPIEAVWHDKLFPYSELKNTKQETEEFAAANGMTKTYICFPASDAVYKVNHPIMIYRKSEDYYNKTHKSVVSSYGTVVSWTKVKSNWKEYVSFEEFKRIVGNKSVFSFEEIKSFYTSKKNLYVLELVYNHAFGLGNNVNHATLVEKGIWKNDHPFQAIYSMGDFRKVLELSKQNPEMLII